MIGLLTVALGAQPGPILRDEYGVPHIRTTDAESAWRAMGRAVAEDRMWQMETSRRAARGTMAEAFGPKYVASDRETLQSGYSDAELSAQLAALSPASRLAFRAYARGVNDFLAAGNLPPGYAAAGLTPKPWTELDSVAIAVKLLRTFGRGGAGEIRNLALLTYLKSRKSVNPLDVMDDLGWREDPKAPTTLPRFRAPNVFPKVSREQTERHLAQLPEFGLLELLGGVRVAEKKASTLVAERVSAPYRSGSYAVLVPARESVTGRPLLLNGPQMGMRAPSVVHEASLDCPEFSVTGIDIPGVPGIVIGQTGRVAWGLTSGVADTDDIVVDRRPALTTDEKVAVNVKGGEPQVVERQRTADGPIVFQTPKASFVRRSAHWGVELKTFDSLAGLWTAKDVHEADAAMRTATMSFNVFMADTAGHTAYRYAGLVPIRAKGFDPRLPLPVGPAAAWRGFVPPDGMPHAFDPPTLTNWNDKPAPGWPNGDTPVWGRMFRGGELRRSLRTKGKLAIGDLEKAAWIIARRDETFAFLGRYAPDFDGWTLDGSVPAARYEAFIARLREELFLPKIGTLVSPDNFQLALQPDLILAALEGRTKADYLAGRKPADVVAAAWAKVPADVPPFVSGRIPVPGGVPIPYIDRGTFIELIELAKGGPVGRDNLPPGEAESGPHAKDQAELARAWAYKPMVR